MKKGKARKSSVDLKAVECSYAEVVGSIWTLGEICEFRLNKMDPSTRAGVAKLSEIK